MQFFNQYSYLWMALAFLGIGLIMLWRWKARPAWLRATIAIALIVAVIGVNFAFRYPETNLETTQDVETILQNGQPTFLMFYSNY
ncbi:MAG: hypothetical protein CUN55_01465 [Phototrophicales bacterium]|nr:MAG: hypothetical protein CUN55_01465 [Phototrophicales bacterium]